MAMDSGKNLFPFMGMVIVLLAQVSNMEVMKAAMSRGRNKYVIIVYSDALSTLIFLICSLIMHRSDCPPLSFPIVCRFFLLSVFGILSQIFSYVGLQNSSATLSTAMLNLIPAFTFILAVIFRMEKLNWRSKISLAKSLGTIVSIAGAFVVTLYEGPTIISTLSGVSRNYPFLSSDSSWIIGGIFLAAVAFLDSASYILLALILKRFPAVLIVMLFLFFFGTIMATILSLIIVRKPSAWKPRLDMELAAILYSAIIGTGMRVWLVTWCLSRIGPLHVSMFKPLAIVFSDAMGLFFQGDALDLGSLIGAIIIVAGFYAVVWGKLKEENGVEQSGLGSSEDVPPLQNILQGLNTRSSVQ